MNEQPEKEVNAQGQPLCGAKTKGGGACKKLAMKNGRCAYHGGLTPSGVAHHNFKHGKRSKYLRTLPDDFRRFFKLSMEDEELLSLREEIGVQSGRIAQLFNQMREDSPPPWGAAVESLNRVKIAKQQSDAAAWEAFKEHEEIVRKGADAAASRETLWEKIQATIQEKTNTAKAEWKRELDLSRVVPVEDALLYLRAMLTAAKETITDRKMLANLQQRMLALIPTDAALGGPVRLGSGDELGGCTEEEPPLIEGEAREA